jgi:hypothetical protein
VISSSAVRPLYPENPRRRGRLHRRLIRGWRSRSRRPPPTTCCCWSRWWTRSRRSSGHVAGPASLAGGFRGGRGDRGGWAGRARCRRAASAPGLPDLALTVDRCSPSPGRSGAVAVGVAWRSRATLQLQKPQEPCLRLVVPTVTRMSPACTSRCSLMRQAYLAASTTAGGPGRRALPRRPLRGPP